VGERALGRYPLLHCAWKTFGLVSPLALCVKDLKAGIPFDIVSQKTTGLISQWHGVEKILGPVSLLALCVKDFRASIPFALWCERPLGLHPMVQNWKDLRAGISFGIVLRKTTGLASPWYGVGKTLGRYPLWRHVVFIDYWAGIPFGTSLLCFGLGW
jgi:hypothetical protein